MRFLCGRFPKLKGPESEATRIVQQSKLLRNWAKMRLCVCCELLCNLTQGSQSTNLATTTEQNLRLFAMRPSEIKPAMCSQRCTEATARSEASEGLCVKIVANHFFQHKGLMGSKMQWMSCCSLVPVKTLPNSLL